MARSTAPAAPRSDAPATLEDVAAWLRFYSQYGLKAQHVARADACSVCLAAHGRVFDPDRAPAIPVPGCTHSACRCSYEPPNPNFVERFRATLAQGLWDGHWGFGLLILVSPLLVLAMVALNAALGVRLPGDLYVSVVFAVVGGLMLRKARAHERKLKPQ